MEGGPPQQGVILRDNPGDSSGHKVSMLVSDGLEVNCSIYQNAKPTALIKTVHWFVFQGPRAIFGAGKNKLGNNLEMTIRMR